MNKNACKFLDFLYDIIDEQALKGNFSNIDDFLCIVKPNGPLDHILGVLTATLPMKHKLNNREGFLRLVKNYYRNDEDLFSGLE